LDFLSSRIKRAQRFKTDNVPVVGVKGLEEKRCFVSLEEVFIFNPQNGCCSFFQNIVVRLKDDITSQYKRLQLTNQSINQPHRAGFFLKS
jgi:hypothetical protein